MFSTQHFVFLTEKHYLIHNTCRVGCRPNEEIYIYSSASFFCYTIVFGVGLDKNLIEKFLE